MKKLTLIIFAILATCALSFGQNVKKLTPKPLTFKATYVNIYETETQTPVSETECSIDVMVNPTEIDVLSETMQVYIITSFLETRKVKGVGTMKYWMAEDYYGRGCQVGFGRYQKDKNYYFVAITYSDYFWVYTMQITK